MATSNSTTTSTGNSCNGGNDAIYVSGTHLSDAAMFIISTMRLIENKDGEAYCLLEKAKAEIIGAQDYLESMDPLESPISNDVAEMLGRIGQSH